MSPFDKLNQAAAEHGLRFLVIGGHAVIEHGFQRGTEDADILVSKDERDQWIDIIGALGYKLFRDGGTFLQFEPPDASEWNLDLMLVPGETFSKLMASAKPVNLAGVTIAIPALEHLLAMKIHALKHGRGLRVLKDTTDVAQLLSVNRIDPKIAWVRRLFEKHGNMELYERIVRLLS